MKTKHKFLSVLLIVLLCVTLSFGLIACVNNDEDKDEAKDSGKYISNGNFEVTTSDTFPKIPGSWTGSAGSTSSDNDTPVDKDSLVAGVIDTDPDVYDKNKKHWDRLKNPQSAGNIDTNVLMIYNPVDNSYKYTSGSFSLDANKYFKIVFSVKTVNMEGHGAYVLLGGDAMVEFDRIDTKGEWSTYSAVIKTHNVNDNSFSVTLSNGRNGKNDGMLSKGYAFFDNIIVSEIDADTYNNAAIDANNQKVDLTLGDNNFVNISGSENIYSARKWTGVSSQGADGETAPTGSDYLERGIIDFNTALPNNFPTDIAMHNDASDQRALMINNLKPTAYGYRSDSRIRFNAIADGYYELSFWVMTRDLEGSTGAYIKLKATSDKNEQIGIKTGINTNGKWEKITVTVKPDSKRNKDIYVEVGLGTGGKNDKDQLVKGMVFFDEMTVTAKSGIAGDEAIDISSTSGDDKFSSDLEQSNFKLGKYTDSEGLNFDGAYRGQLTSEAANGNIPYAGINNIIKMTNDFPTIAKQQFVPTISINKNSYYRLSVWVKTDILNESQGLNVKLYQKAKVEDGKPVSDDTVLGSFDNINTDVLNKDKEIAYNGYVELVFLLEGDFYTNNELYLQFEMGSGNNLTPNTLVKGTSYIADISLYQISYSDYSGESGEQIKQFSLRNQSNTITNATFDKVDLAKTEKQYDDFDEADYRNENTKGAFALPSDWTFTSADQLNDENMVTGVLTYDSTKEAYNEHQLANVGIDSIPNYSIGAQSINPKNVLAIHVKNNIDIADNTKPVWGYTSPNMSLSKNKHYLVSVWAYVANGTKATVSLRSSNKSLMNSFVIDGNGKWTEYKFYIETGFDDFNTYLELAIGDINAESNQIPAGTALFDMPTKTEISEDIYTAAEDALKDESVLKDSSMTVTFTTTTFDNVTVDESGESLDSPANWSAKHNDADSPNGKGNSVAGVYNRDHGNRNLFGGDVKDKDGNVTSTNEPISEDELIKIMNGISEDNNNVLVINNNVATEYEYKTVLANDSLVAESYYKISLKILTYNVESGKTATIRLKLHNDEYEFALNDKRGINVNTDGKWTTYTFYIKTGENVTIDTAELSVSLGRSKEENYVAGYLFVDDVTIGEITEEEFNEAVPEDKFPAKGQKDSEFDGFDKAISATNHRIVFEKENMNNKPAEDEENEADPLLWLYITSGIIGGLLIIAVIVVLMRKFNVIGRLFPKKNPYGEQGKESYNRNRVNANKSTTADKDINEEHKD